MFYINCQLVDRANPLPEASLACQEPPLVDQLTSLSPVDQLATYTVI
jgi:hypothetical protein